MLGPRLRPTALTAFEVNFTTVRAVDRIEVSSDKDMRFVVDATPVELALLHEDPALIANTSALPALFSEVIAPSAAVSTVFGALLSTESGPSVWRLAGYSDGVLV